MCKIGWRESHDVEPLGYTIDNKLSFDEHVSNICLKANRKLSALTRVANLNKLHERALSIVYNNNVTSFENLLIKDKSFTIYHQNIQLLTIEIYEAIHNLPGGSTSEIFVRNNHNYNLRYKSELLLPNANTLFKG